MNKKIINALVAAFVIVTSLVLRHNMVAPSPNVFGRIANYLFGVGKACSFTEGTRKAKVRYLFVLVDFMCWRYGAGGIVLETIFAILYMAQEDHLCAMMFALEASILVLVFFTRRVDWTRMKRRFIKDREILETLSGKAISMTGSIVNRALDACVVRVNQVAKRFRFPSLKKLRSAFGGGPNPLDNASVKDFFTLLEISFTQDVKLKDLYSYLLKKFTTRNPGILAEPFPAPLGTGTQPPETPPEGTN